MVTNLDLWRRYRLLTDRAIDLGQVHTTHSRLCKDYNEGKATGHADFDISLCNRFALLDALAEQNSVLDVSLDTGIEHGDHFGCISPCSGKALSTDEMKTWDAFD